MRAAVGLCVTIAFLVISAPVSGNHEARFTLTDIDGNVWTNDGLRGRVGLLLFTATWCGPCRMAEDALVDLLPTYAAKATFIAVYESPGNSPDELATLRQMNGLPYPLAPDTDQLAARLGVSTIPAAVIFRASGLLGQHWSPMAPFTEQSAAAELGAILDAYVSEIPDPIPIPEAPWWPPVLGGGVASALVVGLLSTGARRKTA